jgi:hypothetical protein
VWWASAKEFIMIVPMVIRRILVDGSILIAIVAPVVVMMLYLNPRIALSDYPPDVRAAVPPRTRMELAQGIVLAILLVPAMIAIPLYSVYRFQQETAATISYGLAYVMIFGEYLLLSLFDLVVLDIGMFYLWTPDFLVIPGTKGMSGYKDWRPHARAQLTTGMVIIAVVAGLVAIVPTSLF